MEKFVVYDPVISKYFTGAGADGKCRPWTRDIDKAYTFINDRDAWNCISYIIKFETTDAAGNFIDWLNCTVEKV